MITKKVKQYTWDKWMREIYDYTFQVSAKEFYYLRKNKFKGTYIVHWGKDKISKEII